MPKFEMTHTHGTTTIQILKIYAISFEAQEIWLSGMKYLYSVSDSPGVLSGSLQTG